MDVTRKIYKDHDEIELAWNELIQAIKPLNVTRVPSANFVPGDPKALNVGKKKRLHHPALLTQRDFNNWEFLV